VSEATLPPRPRHPSERDFKRGLRLSAGLHVALFVLIALKSLVFPGNPVRFTPTLRVDLVGLPDVLKKDLIRVPKTPSSSDLEDELKDAEQEARRLKVPKAKAPVETAEPDEMVIKPKDARPESRDRKLKSALARIRSLEKIRNQDDSEDRPAPPIKGNAISKGSSLSGDAKESSEASYFDSVRERLQDNWALPVWLARQKLTAQVQIFIDSRGRVRASVFVKPSGNSQFDDAIRKTLTESQPFPAPPVELRPGLATDGILVGFPL
jgi:TonB family protein